MTRVRVLRVIARMNVGGPAMQVRGLMEGLDPARFDQLLVTGGVADDERDALAGAGAVPGADQGFRVRRISGLGRRVSAAGDLRAAAALERLIRDFRPHVVHTHTAKAGALGRPLAALHRVPLRVHTFHGHLLHGYFGAAGTRAVIAAERSLAAASHELLAVGERVRADLLAAGVGTPDRFGVMPPGITPPEPIPNDRARRLLGLPGDVPVVAVVGRVADVKRPDRLARVLCRVARERPDTVVLVAGDGAGMPQLRRGLQGVDARFLGWRNDIAAIHCASDLSLLTSDNEGMPVSLIEAGMCARPAVATAVGSVAEVVLHAETGLLCPPDDDALVAAVLDLFADPQRRRKMGAAAQTWTRQRFTVGRLVADHELLYLESPHLDGLRDPGSRGRSRSRGANGGTGAVVDLTSGRGARWAQRPPAPTVARRTALHVGLVIDELGLAGTERQFGMLAASLRDHGCAVSVLCWTPPRDNALPALALLRERGVDVTVLDRPGLPAHTVAMRRWVRRARPDVIHAAMSYSSVVAGLLSAQPSFPPWVLARRSLVSQRRDSPINRSLRELSVRRADAVIANSAAAARDSASTEGADPLRCHVIHNAVDPRFFEPVAAAHVVTDLPIVVSVANLRLVKGHRYLFDAVGRLAGRGSPVTLVCIGAGVDEADVRATAEQVMARTGADIRFAGAAADPRPYLAAADIFVQSSVAESASNSLLEALAVGLPIVATDVGGTADLVGTAAVLVPAGDAAALADAVARLVGGPDLRTDLAVRARRRVSDVAAADLGAAHLDIYRSLLGAGGSASAVGIFSGVGDHFRGSSGVPRHM